MNQPLDLPGYRLVPLGGPSIRTDIIDVYIVRRREPSKIEFLQMRRASAPLLGTWHPIMGHVEAGETAVQAAIRELNEEAGLAITHPAVHGFWALEQTHPFFVHEINAIVISPRFAVEVDGSWEPTRNEENNDQRWIDDPRLFLWPGQRSAANEVIELLRHPDGAAEQLRIPFR